MEGSYYPYSENKGADQLRVYREANLRLCFRICKTPVFSRRGSYMNFVDCWECKRGPKVKTRNCIVECVINHSSCPSCHVLKLRDCVKKAFIWRKMEEARQQEEEYRRPMVEEEQIYSLEKQAEE